MTNNTNIPAEKTQEEAMQLVHELQQVTLAMLKDIDRVCAGYNIPYYLGEGTLLGAVRHKGFIPWDDDVDLLMMRDDYERFLKIAPEAMGEKYEIQHYTTMKNCWTPLLKVRLITDSPKFRQSHIAHVTPNNGPMIDIFPLDNVPALSSPAQTWQGTKMRILRGTLSQKMGTAEANSFAAKALRLVSHFVTRDFLFRCINRIYEKGWFAEAQPLPFEDTTMLVPNGWHELLTDSYGDYMTPPPPEKRVIKHHF